MAHHRFFISQRVYFRTRRGSSGYGTIREIRNGRAFIAPEPDAIKGKDYWTVPKTGIRHTDYWGPRDHGICLISGPKVDPNFPADIIEPAPYDSSRDRKSIIRLARTFIARLMSLRSRDTRERGVRTSLAKHLGRLHRPGGMRACPAGNGKGACALCFASVLNIRLWPSPLMDIGGDK